VATHTLQFGYGTFGSPVDFTGVAASFNGGGGPSPSLTYIGRTEAGSGMSATGVSIGTAGASRRVIVAVSMIQSGTTAVTGSMTIAGISATKVGEVTGANDGNGNSCYSGIFYADVAAGTTATITFSGPASPFDCTFWVYTAAIAGNAIDTFSTAQFGTTPPASPANLSLDVTTSGCVVVVTNIYNLSSIASISWTGATQDNSGSLYGSDTRQVAHYIDPSSGSTVVFRRTLSSIGTRVGSRQMMV